MESRHPCFYNTCNLKTSRFISTFCVRSVDDNLDVSVDGIGLYELDNIKYKAIVNAIKDILLRCHLNLDHGSGRTYDGAGKMMSKRSGVSTQILAEQPKAIVTHCQGHSLSLAIKSLTKDCTILRDIMTTLGEICVLVKYSPKLEKIQGIIVENIEGEFEESSRSDNQKLDKPWVTRWTIRAKYFRKILRIGNCKNQIKLVKFYFGLNLSQRLYAITENLSKTLQQE